MWKKGQGDLVAEEKMQQNRNHSLVVILVILCIIIIGLGVWVVILKNNGLVISQTDNSNLIDVSEEADGWNGEVADSTRALVLTEQIRDKLGLEPDYNPEQAVSEYREKMDLATGDLKIYIALEYANFVYDTYNDPARAASIIHEVEGLTDDIGINYSIATTMSFLYSELGDEEKVSYYEKLINEYIPNSGMVINLEEVKNE